MGKDYYKDYKPSEAYEDALINIQYMFGYRLENIYFSMLMKCIEKYKEYEEKDTPKPIVYSHIMSKFGGLSDYICPVCGHRVQDLDKYCYNCGQKLSPPNE